MMGFVLAVTTRFVAEKLKQRGPARNLYADWIILFKEQFSCLLPKPSFLIMVECHYFKAFNIPAF
jgi:hypothetical protein